MATHTFLAAGNL